MQNTEISVSTAFFPAALFPGVTGRPDLILHSSDMVFFYVHKHVLASKSKNEFAGLLRGLPSPPLGLLSPSSSPGTDSAVLPHLALPETAAVVNIVLHILYNLPCSRYAPSLDAIADALNCFGVYGLPPPPSSSDIWTLLLQHCHANPIKAYAAAASASNEAACVLISQYTLSVPITDTTEADVLTMGPMYLKRLVDLHAGRERALRRLLRSEPASHTPAHGCSEAQQSLYLSTWRSATATIATRETLADVTATDLSDILQPVARSTHCPTCRAQTQAHLTALVTSWNATKGSI